MLKPSKINFLITYMKKWCNNFREKSVDHFDNLIERTDWLKALLKKTGIRDNAEKFSESRRIFINNIRPSDAGPDEESVINYRTNEIITSHYTWYTFVPKNLLEQFRRFINIYFLVNIIILAVVPDPPVNPYAAAMPLIFIILVTAVKQGYEDLRRHREDNKLNSRCVSVLRDGHFTPIPSKNIQCGDIVEVKADSVIPCDLLLLGCKSHQNCYIKTSNLDGETNLKVRMVPKGLPRCENENDLSELRGVINCDKPNSKLYEFRGTLRINDNKIILHNENVLLCGASLRVAPVIYGCVIYAGLDTKMMKNSKFQSNKFSSTERSMNIFVAVFVVLIIVLSLLGLFGSLFYQDIYSTHWYIGLPPPKNQALENFLTFITYINLNALIPTSVYVTFELVRFFNSNFFEWDLEMYDRETDQAAQVNSTDSIEDLGQVDYLFSDKTGTLTENLMVFRDFCIDGYILGQSHNRFYKRSVIYNREAVEVKIRRFIECLSVCHTVQIDNINSNEKYNASSPDELSFIKFCYKSGVIYEGDFLDQSGSRTIRRITYTSSSLSLIRREMDGPFIKDYEVLDLLEFDSTRKRMSIIVRDIMSDSIVVYCKGADSSVFGKSTCGTSHLYTVPLKAFSEKGLRTLVLAYRSLTSDEYVRYKAMLIEANSDVANREASLAKVYDLIESELKILGVTAVEDKLQDGVAETLSTLRKAGIKIWVLTGDKLETAMSISDSCKHFSVGSHKFILRDLKERDAILKDLEAIERRMDQNKDHQFELIIDGYTLSHIFEAEIQQKFAQVAMRCFAVLCCRMSPSQKASIVRIVKTSESQPITCAIGDGANDVSMIQEANVGIGIFGKEGRDAARTADFALARFKHLRRALLVHGYFFYTRSSAVVLYLFYNNFVFNICQIYYGFWNAFSSANVYNSLYLSFYNVFFTSVPIIAYGVLEQKNPIEKLEDNPYFYKTISKNRLLSANQFGKWTMLAIWHSLTAFYCSFSIFYASIYLPDGKLGGQGQLGAMLLTLICIISNLRIFIEWRFKTVFTLLSFLFSFGGYIGVCLVFNSFIVPGFLNEFTDGQNVYFEFFVLFTSVSFWFTLILAVVIAHTPDILIAVVDEIMEKRLFAQLTLFDKMQKLLLNSLVKNWLLRNKKAGRDLTVNENLSLNEMGNISIDPAPARTPSTPNTPPLDDSTPSPTTSGYRAPPRETLL